MNGYDLIVLRLLWVAIGALQRRGTEQPANSKTPLEILEERYARGEIDTADFEERRRLLRRESC